MIKNAAVQDPEANSKKQLTDFEAGKILGVDSDAIRSTAREIVQALNAWCGRGPHEGTPSDATYVIAGGAGSGKTSIAAVLAAEMGLKHLDLDTFIPGGYTRDRDEYARRFNKGLYEMWEEIPKKSWVIDHVHACSPELVLLYHPKFAIFVNATVEHLFRVAEARSRASHDETGEVTGRKVRAVESKERAHAEFRRLQGELVKPLIDGLLIKDLR
jgi:hypothetical protein